MCLAIPARIVSLDGEKAIVEISSNYRETNVCLIENPQIGDYVLLHAGFAIDKVDIETAQEILEWQDLE